MLVHGVVLVNRPPLSQMQRLLAQYKRPTVCPIPVTFNLRTSTSLFPSLCCSFFQPQLSTLYSSPFTIPSTNFNSITTAAIRASSRFIGILIISPTVHLLFNPCHSPAWTSRQLLSNYVIAMADIPHSNDSPGECARRSHQLCNSNPRTFPLSLVQSLGSSSSELLQLIQSMRWPVSPSCTTWRNTIYLLPIAN